MPDFADIMHLWPAWLALSVSGLVALNKAIDESQKLSNFLGGWARRRHQRAQRKATIEESAPQIANAVEKAVEDARRIWESKENEALAALDRRLDAVGEVTEQQSQDLILLRGQIRCMSAFAEYESQWHGKLRRELDANDCIPIERIPKYIDYYEFETLFNIDPRWRAWG